MLNVSTLAMESSELLPPEKLLILLFPDLYLAENIGDYQRQASAIVVPAYKRVGALYINGLVGVISPLHALIAISNVGLEPHPYFPHCFWMHDNTGREMMSWSYDQLFTPVVLPDQFTFRIDEPEWFTVYLARVPRWKEAYIVDVDREPMVPPKNEKEVANLAKLVLCPV